jgi:hypothetical protein
MHLESSAECVARDGDEYSQWSLVTLWMREVPGDQIAKYALQAAGDGPNPDRQGRLVMIRREHLISTLLELDRHGSEHFIEVTKLAVEMDNKLLDALAGIVPSECATPDCA